MTEADIDRSFNRNSATSLPRLIWEGLDPRADLREALDINSMDFLNFVIAVHRRLNVEFPELDYPKLVTLDGAVAYLHSKIKSGNR